MPAPRFARIMLLSLIVSLACAGIPEAAAEDTVAAKKAASTKTEETAEAEEEDAPKSPAERAECRFLGVKMIRVLLRDDLIAAEGFHQFYERFDCPTEHLGRALGCAAPATRVEDAAELQRHAEACWTDPSAAIQVRVPVKPTPKEGGADGSPRSPRSGTSPF